MFILSLIEINKIPLIYHTNNFYAWKGGDSYEKFLEYDLTKHHEILFLGSSRSYRHYDPAIFENAGILAFNLGTNNQSAWGSSQIIEHYINSQNSKIIVYDLYVEAIRLPASVESSSYLISNISNNEAALDIALNMNDSKAVNLYFVRWLMQNKTSMYKEEGYQGRGFCTKQDTFDIEELIHNESLKTSNIYTPLDEKELLQLEELILKCKAKKVQLILVHSPTSKFYTVKNHVSFLQQIQPILNKYQVVFFDYAKELSIPTETHFYDYSHMNYEGVKIFNKQLIEDLQKSKIIRKKMIIE